VSSEKLRVAELDRKWVARKQQVIGHQHHRHGLAMQQMQQDLLITDWALHPSVYPSVTQSVVFDGALHVYVFVQLFFGAIA